MQYARLIFLLTIGELVAATVVSSKYQVEPKVETSGLLYSKEVAHGSLARRELEKRTKASSSASSTSALQPQPSSTGSISALQNHRRIEPIGRESRSLTHSAPPSDQRPSPEHGLSRQPSQTIGSSSQKHSHNGGSIGQRQVPGSSFSLFRTESGKISSQHVSPLAQGPPARQRPHKSADRGASHPASRHQAALRTDPLQSPKFSLLTHDILTQASTSERQHRKVTLSQQSPSDRRGSSEIGSPLLRSGLPKDKNSMRAASTVQMEVAKTKWAVRDKVREFFKGREKLVSSASTASESSQSVVSRPLSVAVPRTGSKTGISPINQVENGAETTASSWAEQASSSPQSSRPIMKGKSTANPTTLSNAFSGSHERGRVPELKAMTRSNSDPLGPGSSNIRRPWGKATRLSRRPPAVPRSFQGSSELIALTPSTQSHASLEINPSTSPQTAASSGRSAIASSVFAQLAQGPAIVGAGLKTTIQADSDASIDSSYNSRRTSAASSMGSYEMPGRFQDHGFNGGTASGPQSLTSTLKAKGAILNAFLADQPMETVRLASSGAGHALLGAGPAMAAAGNLPIAAAFGASGASFSYLGGNERLIPKIEQWQRVKGRIP